MDLKDDLEGDSTKGEDVFSKLTEGKTAGIPNLIWFAVIVFVLILIIKRRQASSSASNTAGQFNLPYLGGFPIDIVTTGPPGPPGKQGPAGPPGKGDKDKRTPPPHKKKHKKKPRKPIIKKATPIKGFKGGRGGPLKGTPIHSGHTINQPTTPPLKRVSVAAVRPTRKKTGSTSQRHTAKRSGIVHHRVPDRTIAKGAHR